MTNAHQIRLTMRPSNNKTLARALYYKFTEKN